MSASYKQASINRYFLKAHDPNCSHDHQPTSAGAREEPVVSDSTVNLHEKPNGEPNASGSRVSTRLGAHTLGPEQEDVLHLAEGTLARNGESLGCLSVGHKDSSAPHREAGGCIEAQQRTEHPSDLQTVVEGDESSQEGAGICSSSGSEGSACCDHGLESSNDEPNAYELEREERIMRNKEVMRKLGLDTLAARLAPMKRQAFPRRKTSKQEAQLPARQYPLRSKKKQLTAGGTEATGAELMQVEEAEEPAKPEQFDDSSVLKYTLMESSSLPRSAYEDLAGPPKCLEKLNGNLWDKSRTQLYSLDVRHELLAAGGKGGHAAVWTLQGLQEGVVEQDREPLISAKLHKGWIADVQLCSGVDSGSRMLLTAGNDAVLALWDLHKVVSGSTQPQCVAQTSSLHSGGIFSMHERSSRILTASKDESVAITSLTPGGGLVPLRTYEQHHAGVVKCARWRDEDIFASCGNDRCIRIADIREDGGGGTVIMEAHSAAVSFLHWNPCDANLLLSTAFDDALHVFDIRHPAQPLHAFRGHTGGRVSKIYQPAFVAGGTAIVSGGPGSKQLSVYCLQSGRTLSRGDAGVEILATCSTGSHPCAAVACTSGRSVSFYCSRKHQPGPFGG